MKILYKRVHIFRRPQPNTICEIPSKRGQKGDFDSHIENISVQSSWEFIINQTIVIYNYSMSSRYYGYWVFNVEII
jgi:hypothetical protein